MTFSEECSKLTIANHGYAEENENFYTKKGDVNMATTKKVAAKEVAAKVEAPKAVKEETVKKEAVKAVKKEAVKKEPAKKEVAKKEPVKKEVAKKASAKKAPAKKAELKSELHIQFEGKSYAQDDLMKMAKDVWRYDLKQKVSALTSVELYVKPEENMVYYVMNKEFTGSFYI